MERLHLTPTVLNWILEYVNDRISNNERWDIAREVKSFAAWIFKEAYLAREHEMREVLRENKRIGELRTALNYELHASLDIVQSAAANFRAEMEAWGLGFDQFSRGSTIDTYLRRIEDGNMRPSSAARSKATLRMRKKCSARPTAPWRTWLKPPPTSANCWQNCAASKPNNSYATPVRRWH